MDSGMDADAMKRILMVAYHFPPIHGSSGIQRTLRFAQYLPEYGWEPAVLTVHPRAYPSTMLDSLGEVPPKLAVYRTFALDSARHLSIRGKYPRFLAVPDRWVSWWLSAVPMGMGLIRKLKPHVIWSTCPIATAHLIGLTLNRVTGIPWVADFRDPIVQEDYPAAFLSRKAFRWLEHRVLKHCTKAAVTTPGMLHLYSERYPDISSSRLAVIENGYDEESFAQAERLASGRPAKDEPIVLVHSGTIYPLSRNPRAFFAALSELKQCTLISASSIRVVLRAAQHEDFLRALIYEYGIGDLVVLRPPAPYLTALAEMLTANGLLLLQASSYNNQIPAKLYEYLRARRPILALTDPAGNTAAALRGAGINTLAALDSKDAIKEALLNFLGLIREGRGPVPDSAYVKPCSRRRRTEELVKLLESLY